MKKISNVLIVLVLFWVVVGSIKPYQVAEENPWRKEDRTLISAHRGGANLNPENTEMAFDYVIIETHYTDIIELDVRLTKDGHLVIIHDESINRTGIKGEVDEIKINEKNLEELSCYNLGVNFVAHDGSNPYDFKEDKSVDELKNLGLSIMTFDDFLAKYENERYFRVLVEIKDSAKLGMKCVDAAESIIAKYPKWDERIMTISFSTDVVKYTLDKYPNRYVAGMGYNMIPFLAGSLLRLDSLFQIKYQSVQTSMITKAGSISINCATQQFVDSAHKRNQCVAYWTINEEEDMRHLINIGADVITTNSPDLLAEVLGLI